MQNTQGKTALGLDQNVGALICYVGNLICSFGLIYSIIVVVQDKTNKIVRFHAFQSILSSVLGMVVGIAIAVVAILAGVADAFLGIPLFSLIVGLAAFVVAMIFVVKIFKAAKSAYRGEIYKMPIIGNMADKWV